MIYPLQSRLRWSEWNKNATTTIFLHFETIALRQQSFASEDIWDPIAVNGPSLLKTFETRQPALPHSIRVFPPTNGIIIADQTTCNFPPLSVFAMPSTSSATQWWAPNFPRRGVPRGGSAALECNNFNPSYKFQPRVIRYDVCLYLCGFSTKFPHKCSLVCRSFRGIYLFVVDCWLRDVCPNAS